MSEKRVLIVEDSRDWQRLVRNILEGAGHTVVGVVDTQIAAVAATREHHPDVIFMDGELAEGSGLQAAQEIRAFDNSVRIIMLSGRDLEFEGVGLKKARLEIDDLLAAVQ